MLSQNHLSLSFFYSGVMGNREKQRRYDGPVSCYNGPKSWKLGWYSDRHETIDPSKLSKDGQVINMIGLANYENSISTDKVIVQITNLPFGNDEMIPTDYYIVFNRKVGINWETQEGGDKVSTGLIVIALFGLRKL